VAAANGQRVRKAVLPVAGLGTRMLPATKALPKVMLPLVDKPAIQYVIEEAVRAGLDDILIITGRGKNAVEDHFDRAVELELELESRGKHDLLKQVRAITDMATIHYVRQSEPKGLGHAVSIAREHVGDEPFAVLLPDDIMQGPVLEGMLDAHARTGRPVLALLEVAPEEIGSYGSAGVEPFDGDGDGDDADADIVRVREVVEKPDPADAPSNLAVIGRYVLTPDVFDALERVVPGKGGEIQLTDAIAMLLADGVYGYRFSGGRFDTGNPLDYLRATVELAVQRDDLGPAFRSFLRELVQREGF
jgi:UTP--glucose-1-phosphate uridylyltransferase